MAAAPERGRQQLRLNPENRGDNRLYRGTYQGKLETWDSLTVEGRPVDNVLSEMGIDQVNFVKIDIQGYEQLAISGFRKTLERSKNIYLMSEFWPKGLMEAGGSPKDYLQLLKDVGFTLFELKEKPRGKVVPLEDWGKLIARLPERKYTNIIGVKGYTPFACHRQATIDLYKIAFDRQIKMTEAVPSANRQIARAAGTVMFAIVLGQIAGLVRGILVARAFPAFELDAFFAANQVSETLFMLLAAGALSSAFIPTFTGLLARGEKASAWKLASSIANLLILTLTTLAVLAAVFAPQIVRYALAPGFSSNSALFALTVDLLRIQLGAAVLFGLGGLIVGILNAHQVFLIPALTPSMYQLGMIFGVLVLAPTMGIYGLAWGVVIGAALYMLLQIPSLLKQKVRYSPTLGLENAAVREVFRLMGPRVLGVAVVQLNFWVNIWLASKMVSGSVAGLRYGFSLMLMAQAAIAQSVAIAAMPTFSAQFALGKLDELRASLASSIRGSNLPGATCQHRLDPFTRTNCHHALSAGRIRRPDDGSGGLGITLVRGRHARAFYTGGADPRLLCPARYEDSGHRGRDRNGIECGLQYHFFKSF